MTKLWKKQTEILEFVNHFISSDNVQLDQKLVKYDCLASIAHAHMLLGMGLLSQKEYGDIHHTLTQIIEMDKEGDFIISTDDEDVHTKIENHLVSMIGDAGLKIHTARSRNDQVLVALKLWTKDQLIKMSILLLDTASTFAALASHYENVPLPGYTHMQRAMPSSLGQWLGSFAEALLQDAQSLHHAYEYADKCPLGSAASYGVPLPIDRQYVSDLLGFASVDRNVLTAQMSRSKSHLCVVHACTQVMLTLARWAQDMLTYSTSEFDLFNISEKVCTGSSIMPQKKNADILELIRARTHAVVSHASAISTSATGLMSGYNSDVQESKQPLFSSVNIVTESLMMTQLVLDNMTPNLNKLNTSINTDLTATQSAYELVAKGVPFRTAYKEIGAHLKHLKPIPFSDVVAKSTHIGGLGNLQLNQTVKEIQSEKKKWIALQKKFADMEISLMSLI